MHYWVGRAVGDDDVGGYEPNAEIDEVAWFPIDKARDRLTYQFDIDTLDEALAHAQKTRALVVLRHSQARSRKAWRGDDRERPLLATGKHQAERLVPVLAAYDVRRLVSSPSTRCVQTLEPLRRGDRAQAAHRGPAQRGGRQPEGGPRRARAAADGLNERPASAGGWSLCTHRPVLPWVFDALGLDDPGLGAGRAARPAPAQGPDSGGRAAPHHAELPCPAPRRAVVHVIVVSRPRCRHETACPVHAPFTRAHRTRHLPSLRSRRKSRDRLRRYE